jgi:hypothetical protein
MTIVTFHRNILVATGMAFIAFGTFLTVPGSVFAVDNEKEEYKWIAPKGEVLIKDVADDDTVEVRGNTWEFNGALLPKNKYYRLTTNPCMKEYVPKKDVIVVSFHISEVVSSENVGMEGGKDTWKIRVKKHK